VNLCKNIKNIRKSGYFKKRAKQRHQKDSLLGLALQNQAKTDIDLYLYGIK